MEVSFKAGSAADKGWSYSMPQKTVPVPGQGGKDVNQGNLSPKRTGYDAGVRSPTGKTSSIV